MQPRSKIWIEIEGDLVLSDWRVALLEAIEETGSLAKAAEKHGIAYRRAWGKIKEMEDRLGTRLIEAQAGGVGGGSTQLTPQAKEYIAKYRRFQAGIPEMVDKKFREIFG